MLFSLADVHRPWWRFIVIRRPTGATTVVTRCEAMNPLITKVAIVLSCCTVATPTNAYATVSFESGNELYSMCQRSDDFSKAYCIGYIIGAVDAVGIMFQVFHKQQFCVPPGVSVQLIKDRVLLFLQNNPQARNMEAPATITAALVENYPCQ